MNKEISFQKFINTLPGLFNNTLMEEAKNHNPWFVPEFISESLHVLPDLLLKDSLLQTNDLKNCKVFCQGSDSVPLESLTDILMLISAGYDVIFQLPEKNDRLMDLTLQSLMKYDSSLSGRITLSSRPDSKAGIYILGNSIPAGYIQKYFGDKQVYQKPSYYSAAILKGTENDDNLKKLAGDLLLFFGRGKGSVKKIYVPENYRFDKLFGAMEGYRFLKDHHHYYNYYQYTRSIYLLDSAVFLDNDFFMIKENTGGPSPVGTVFFERYTEIESIGEKISRDTNTYSVYSDEGWFDKSLPFGSGTKICMEADKRCMDFIKKLNG